MQRSGMQASMWSGRGRTGGVLIGALAVAICLLDFVVLRGDQVAHESVDLRDRRPALLQLEGVGEEHLLEISTRRRVRGEHKGQALRIRLEDPQGTPVYEDSELLSRERRFVEFTPGVAGSYRLYLEDSGSLLGSSGGRARVSVFVNDRRIFGRVFSAIPF